MAEEKKAKPEPKKRATWVAVKILQTQGKSALVEYLRSEQFHRCYIPTESIRDDGKASLDELNAGIIYGLDWSKIGALEIDPSELDRVLKAKGFFTLEDLQAQPREVNLLLMALAGATKTKLVEFARLQEA